MVKKGVYAATLSLLNQDLSLNVEATINHAESIIKQGLHGVFFFGSTGQSQLISNLEKKELISKISQSKFRKNFYLGTGCNSLNETLDLIGYGINYNFNTYLIMPPAYYKGNTDQGVYKFYSLLIKKYPNIKIILYNFEKLSGYKFSKEMVLRLVNDFKKNIIGCKDSSYNLFENLKIKNFLMFPGSEAKLLDGLEKGCDGCISATTNVTHFLARKVFDDYEKKQEQISNKKLVEVRKLFDKYNLISALHSYLAGKNKIYQNLLPPLINLTKEEKNLLVKDLLKLKFNLEENRAA